MAEQSFEKALEELEKIVEKLEEGGGSLDDSLKFFERGVKLSRFLRTELDRAEKKIEILLKDETGELKTVPFDQENEPPKELPAEKKKEQRKDSENSGETGSGTLPF
jgi:exodeoxyribonuclease VII small subunit